MILPSVNSLFVMSRQYLFDQGIAYEERGAFKEDQGFLEVEQASFGRALEDTDCSNDR